MTNTRGSSPLIAWVSTRIKLSLVRKRRKSLPTTYKLTNETTYTHITSTPFCVNLSAPPLHCFSNSNHLGLREVNQPNQGGHFVPMPTDKWNRRNSLVAAKIYKTYAVQTRMDFLHSEKNLDCQFFNSVHTYLSLVAATGSKKVK